jgi:drug/metabolite transporter (DMT)-like permease
MSDTGSFLSGPRRDHIDPLGASLLIGFSALLGLNQALVKVVNAGMSPLFQSGARSACAFVVLLIWAAVVRSRLDFRNGSIPWGILAGVLFALEFALLFIALDYTTVSRVSLFFYSMPLFAAIGAHFLLPEERLHAGKLIGLAVAFTGLAIGLADESSAPSDQAWIGDLLAVGGAIFWAAIALGMRTTPLQKCSSEQIMIYQLGVSAILLLGAAPLFGDTVRDLTPSILLIFAFQVIAVASIGYLLWARILAIYPVGNMASFSLLAPVFGVFSGWLLFDDSLTARFVIALTLVGAGLVLINRRPASSNRA